MIHDEDEDLEESNEQSFRTFVASGRRWVPTGTRTDGPIGRDRWLPRMGESVWFCDYRSGDRWFDRPRRVIDRSGGYPRVDRKGRPLPPRLVRFKLDGMSDRNWWPWFQLEQVEEVYP